jgi:hypothetical protein
MGLTRMDPVGERRNAVGELDMLAAAAIDSMLALRLVATRGSGTAQERALLAGVAREAAELQRFIDGVERAPESPIADPAVA